MANNEEIKNEEQLEKAEGKAVESANKENSASVAPKDNKKEKVNPKNKKGKKSNEKKVGAVSKTFSELKKVSWPTFGQVVKQTSVVLVVTLAFLLVVFGLDRLCSLLVGLIVS